MKVKIKMLYSDAIPPKYAHPGDACADVYAFSTFPDDNDNLVIGLGFAIEIPEGYVGLLFPRSSIAKTGHSFRNSVGVIDSGYRGELMIKLSSEFGKQSYTINERVGQLMILPYPQIEFKQVDQLSDTARGAGGFGSTGKS
jgi:dUTP pyrophosphatase